MEQKTINETHKKIIEWFQNLKFKRKLIGGLDEKDVLKRMEELNRLYESALLYERARYDTLLSQQTNNRGDSDE